MQIFGTEHIVYMVVSAAAMAGLLVVFRLFIPKNKAFARLRGIFTRKRKAAAGQVLTNSETDEQEK